MEKRLNRKLETYISNFKENICEKAKKLELDNQDKAKELLQYICDYDSLFFNKEDFLKRKRVKNIVPICDRCSAKRATNEQCTRRKKEGSEYCGTHIKGLPNGIVKMEVNANDKKKVEVWAEEIHGIVYYIDNFNNVYEMSDIINSKMNPKIIAKYVKIGNTYSIPEFDI